MTTRLTLPEPEFFEISLAPRNLLHVRAEVEALEHRVRLGRPFVVRLNSADAEQDARQFMRADKGRALYYVLSLSISFYPAPEEPLVSADVGVLLTHNGPIEVEDPIAWSLSPLKVVSADRPASTIELTAKLGIVEPKITRPIQEDNEDIFLMALGERQKDPEWRFRATRRVELVGIHRLAAVVRAPIRAQCAASIIVTACVRRRRVGLIQYRAQLPSELANVKFPS